MKNLFLFLEFEPWIQIETNEKKMVRKRAQLV